MVTCSLCQNQYEFHVSPLCPHCGDMSIQQDYMKSMEGMVNRDDQAEGTS